MITPLREQACISVFVVRPAAASGGAYMTCLFARLPLFAVGPPFLEENNRFPLGNDATARIVSRRARGLFFLGGAYMLVRPHACSPTWGTETSQGAGRRLGIFVEGKSLSTILNHLCVIL